MNFAAGLFGERGLLWIAAAVALVTACAHPGPQDEAPVASAPNVVIVLADDLGIGDLGCYNPESKIPTPCLDRLAAEGMAFTDMHSPSAVCSPTRYALLTGRYCWRSRLKQGVLWGRSPALIEPGRPTLATLLRDRGHATAAFGKWHLGFGTDKTCSFEGALRPGPLTVGFDAFYGIPSSLDIPPYLWVDGDRAAEPLTAEIAASDHRRRGGDGFWRKGAISASFDHAAVLDEIVDRSIAFIDAHGREGRPFFAYVPLTAPHTPWLPDAAFRDRSGCGHYGDFVAQVDAGIGRIVAAVDALGAADETVVIVTSDNGSHWPVSDVERWGHRANLHYRGQKADIHEGGHRVPFIVRWTGRIPPGSRSDETACLTDLLASIAAIVGAPLPENGAEDSFDLSPVWLGTTTTRPDRSVVHHSSLGMFAIRRGDWKLVLGRGSGGFTAPARIPPEALGPDDPEGQLYDLRTDPGERYNRWNDEPEIVARLTAELERIRTAGRSR